MKRVPTGAIMNSQNNLAERLEGRMLLSVASFASISSRGTLSIVGTRKNDTIVICSPGGKVVVAVNGAEESFLKSSVRRVWVDGFRGDDTINVADGVDVPTTLRGGAGDDSVHGSYFETTLLEDLMDTSIELSHGGVLAYQWEGELPVPKINSFDGYILVDDSGMPRSINLAANITGVGGVAVELNYNPNVTIRLTDADDNL
jgi:hypothetical protein